MRHCKKCGELGCIGDDYCVTFIGFRSWAEAERCGDWIEAEHRRWVADMTCGGCGQIECECAR